MATRVVRAPMSRSKRAAQFAMFDALKGLREAVLAKTKIPEQKRILAEDAISEINLTLTELVKGQTVTAVYYCQYAQEYRQLTGPVVKVDDFWKLLHIGNVAIDFSEIAELHAVLKEHK